MKPFDLAAALRGEPCVTRGGHKVEIIAVYADDYFPMEGRLYFRNLSKPLITRWFLNGLHVLELQDRDIVGMWEDPPSKRTFGGLEWEAPLSERRGHMEPYYWLNSTFEVCECKSDLYGSIHQNRLDAGNYFATREAAQSFANALKTFAKGSVSNPPPSEPQTE